MNVLEKVVPSNMKVNTSEGQRKRKRSGSESTSGFGPHTTSQQGNTHHSQGRGQQQTWTNQGRAEVGMTAHRAATPLATEAAALGTSAPEPEAAASGRQPGPPRSLPRGPIQRPDRANSAYLAGTTGLLRSNQS
jgi:hypothetical protein